MKRALIIDCGFGDLVASATSAERMRECLVARAFVVHELRGASATAAAIEAWLVGSECRELGPGDALVVYFVGHGEVARDEAYKRGRVDQEPDLADLWFLITQDIRDPRSSQAGIAGIELTQLLRPIAEATGNVTVILDCCHAAGMVAGGPGSDPPSKRVRAALSRVNLAIRSKYARHRSRSFASAGPGIVCLVAATRSEIAVEGPRLDGSGEVGLFSDAVAASLAHPSADEWTWDDHIVAIQERVLRQCPTQRPGVEGLRHRFPFSTDEREPDGSHPCTRGSDGELLLCAGLVHGVESDDRFALVRAADPSRRLAEARVAGLGVNLAALDAEGVAVDRDELLRARPLRRARPMTLAVHGLDSGEAARLWAVLPDRIGVAPAEPGSEADAILEQGAHGLTLRHAGDLVHVDGARDEPARLGRVLAAVARVAHFHRVERGLRALAAIAGAPEVEVCWGSGDVALRPGAVLRHGDSLWVNVRPLARAELHASAFHVRGDRSVIHLTEALDHGRTSMRGCVTDLTQTACGERMVWPLRRESGHWDAHRTRESIVLLVSPRAIGLHALATPRGALRGEAPRLALRGAPPAVLRLDFLLEP